MYAAAPAEVAAPEPPPESMGLGEMASSAVGNLPGSAWQFAKDVTAPIHSPIETAKGLGGLAAGAYQSMARGAKGLAVGPEEAQKLEPGAQEKNVDALIDFVKERFGGWENIKNTVAEDPAGFPCRHCRTCHGRRRAGREGGWNGVKSREGWFGSAKSGPRHRPREAGKCWSEAGWKSSIHGCFGSSRADDRSKRRAHQGGFQERSGRRGARARRSLRTSRAMCRWIKLSKKPAQPSGNMHKDKMEAYRSGSTHNP